MSRTPCSLLGQFLPDAPDYKNPGYVMAKNVIPTTGGYGPFLSAAGSGDSLTSASPPQAFPTSACQRS